jgi:hypothetical protein
VGQIVGDGKERWDFLPAVSNIASVTTVELAAGMKISQVLLEATGFAPATAGVPTSSIEETFDIAVPGRRSYSDMKMRMKKQPGTDTVKNTLIADAEGYLVRRRSVAVATAYASAQKIEVYPVIIGEPSTVDFEPNMIERYDVPFFPSAQPQLNAVVA